MDLPLGASIAQSIAPTANKVHNNDSGQACGPAITLAIPPMAALNVMQLSSPRNAVLAALVFNALVIPALIPLALRGVRFKPASANALLRNNMLVYGVGGVLLPFAAIKVIDLVLAALFNF